MANNILLTLADGIGATVSWKYWGPLEQVKPLTIRIDLPLWLNRPPYAEEDYLKFQMGASAWKGRFN